VSLLVKSRDLLRLTLLQERSLEVLRIP